VQVLQARFCRQPADLQQGDAFALLILSLAALGLFLVYQPF
jgi:hypothetical protein